MIKEQIIELICENCDSGCFGEQYMYMSYDVPELIAHKLLGIIDREKKEQAKEIFAKIYNEIKYCSVGQIVIRQLAKEYGVEL